MSKPLHKDRFRLAPPVPFKFAVEGVNGLKEMDLKLAFDFNSMALVEEKTGISLLNGGIFKHPSVTTLSVLFWAALQCYHDDEYGGDFGLEQVRAMMTYRNSASVDEAVNEAYMAQLPDAEQKKIRDKIAENAAKALKEGNADQPAEAVPENPLVKTAKVPQF